MCDIGVNSELACSLCSIDNGEIGYLCSNCGLKYCENCYGKFVIREKQTIIIYKESFCTKECTQEWISECQIVLEIEIGSFNV